MQDATPATAAEAVHEPLVRYAYRFGARTDGGGSMRATLGGKGAGLAEMARLGLDVPAGFTLSTELCAIYTDAQKKGLDASVWEEVQMGVRFVEGAMGRTFFSSHKPCSGLPLLLSVRSGAAASMPGMMDTILNVGLNDEVVEALCADTAAATTAERRFVRDAFRRLLDMFGDVVLRIPREAFECELADLKRSKEVQSDTDLSDADLKELCAAYKRVYAKHSVEFPSDPEVQLRMAIEAVLASWNNPRAIKYRAINRECADLKGTAVNVQAMVFGNRDERSCSGVCFTRDPRSGLNAPLANADTPADVRPSNRELIDAFSVAIKQLHANKSWCDLFRLLMDITQSTEKWTQARSGGVVVLNKFVSSFCRWKVGDGEPYWPALNDKNRRSVYIYGKKKYLSHVVHESFFPENGPIGEKETIDHLNEACADDRVVNVMNRLMRVDNLRKNAASGTRASSAPRRSKPIEGRPVDGSDGEWTTYPSAQKAARVLGLRQGHISAVVRGERNHAGGFFFRPIADPVLPGERAIPVVLYVDENDNDIDLTAHKAQVTDQGRFRTATGPWYTPMPAKNEKYARVGIGGSVYNFHRLVICNFVGRPPERGMVVMHKENVSSDNRLERLTWGTQSENRIDAHINKRQRVM